MEKIRLRIVVKEALVEYLLSGFTFSQCAFNYGCIDSDNGRFDTIHRLENVQWTVYLTLIIRLV